MRILLPPSETKRAGGDGAPLNLSGFVEPALNPFRSGVIEALQLLSKDRENAARVLKLSARQLGSIDDNEALSASPTMPAVERYTGVLYDALDAPSLQSRERRWVDQHVFIQSAAFGRIAATDLIPTYRLSASTALPGLTVGEQAVSLKTWWVRAHAQLPELSPDKFTLDLRSQDYVALAPLLPSGNNAWVNVAQQDEHGVVRALNHFNKTAKGQLVRLIAQTQPEISNRNDFLDWASSEDVSCTADPTGPITVLADSISLRASQNG